MLDRNPLENIRYTDSVFRVVLNGRVYDTSLAEIGGRPAPKVWLTGR